MLGLVFGSVAGLHPHGERASRDANQSGPQLFALHPGELVNLILDFIAFHQIAPTANLHDAEMKEYIFAKIFGANEADLLLGYDLDDFANAHSGGSLNRN